MRRPPNAWINWAARYEVSDELVGQVIAGPFHAQGCNGQLREDWSITPGQRPIVDPVCPVCRVELWNPLARIKLFDLRWQVLQELQRLQRLYRGDNPLTSTVALNKPEYWRSLMPSSRVGRVLSMGI
jgi:hypothetical protein